MLRVTLLLFAALVAVSLVAGTQVDHCDTEEPYEDDKQVQISGCDAPPCILRRGSLITVLQRFTPTKAVQNLITSVSANIFGVPLPFIGVDGVDACKDIYDVNGTKTGCPLEEGVERIYRNSFPILQFYPKVQAQVFYALTEGSDKIACFTVPAKITD